MLENNQKLFALDIGTRSVVGIMLEESDGNFKIIDIISEEHKERAMLDGQIHDVPAVSNVILDIKEKLEEKHGPLKKVCVAAAGRALKTQMAHSQMDIKGKPLLTKEDVLHLELDAVQKAQSLAAEQQNESKSYHYYCVGYSVLHYHLDEEEIGSLIDQQGDEAAVDIIATFLPRVVVESLIAALNRANLEMEALTLEPIAAINVLIPPSMRRLNVALVDIGAGTSDIALTNTGTVTAYGMVPTAGDEITESLSEQFLLDFPIAEKVKRELQTSELITITDILGFETEIPKEEVVEKITPSIKHLASEIADELQRLNNKQSPQAVMLVGGGSLTPQLPKWLSTFLNLPDNRVAVRGVDAIQNLSIADNIDKGPELVTPIGIAIAARQVPVQYVTAYINEQPVRVFEVKNLTVGDCLLGAGIKISKLYGKPGNAYIISVNGQSITLPGGYGKAPVVKKNNHPCSLEDKVSDGDSITIINGEDGLEPNIKIADLIEPTPPKTIYINGKPVKHSLTINKNGKKASTNEKVQDKDTIQITYNDQLSYVLESHGFSNWLEQWKPYRITLDGKDTFIPLFSGKVLVNGKEVKPSYKVESNDTITLQKPTIPTLGMLAEKKQQPFYRKIDVSFNGEKVSLYKECIQVYRNGELIQKEDLVKSGDRLKVAAKNLQQFIFQDLFQHVDIEMPANATGKFLLLRNGEEISFHHPIYHGDELEIRWPLNTHKK
jgi:cell division protein FtsA